MESRILIIDDKLVHDKELGKQLKDFFKSKGYETIFADSGEAALDIIDRHIPRLILLDIEFPGQPMEGKEIFDRVKTKYPFVPIVILTIRNKVDDFRDFVDDRGAIDYLIKDSQITEFQFKQWEKEINNCKKNEKIYKYQERLRGILYELRKHMPMRTIDMSKPADVMGKLEWLRGKTVRALNVTLTPTGCLWANQSGCTVCGEFSGSNLSKPIKADVHIAQFLKAYAEEIGTFRPEWLRIYNEGSFLNTNELAKEAQEKIIEIASNISGIERITIESRPEFITIENIETIKSKLKQNVELEIGIGFETKEDVIRDVLINKGESLYMYKKAIEVLKENEIRCLAYVLLKPPFLSELDAIQDAENTIKFAFDYGFDAISLEPVSIHNFSFIDLLHSQKLYQPPWLWSVARVVKSTFHYGEIRIGGLEYYPRPKNVANNRGHTSGDVCNNIFWSAIALYNATHNPDLFSFLRCGCSVQWEQELQPRTQAMHEILEDTLNKLDVEKYLKEALK